MMILYLLILLSCLIYWRYVRPLSYWKDRGIPYIPGYPFFGNFLWSVLSLRTFDEEVNIVYNKIPDKKCVGTFAFTFPALMIRDPEMLKQLTIKEFEHFTDHVPMFNEKVDKIVGNNLFALRGNRWRSIRSTLSPAFTGSKMRGMFNLMIECGHQFTNHYQRICNKAENPVDVDLKDIYMRYTIDAIGSAAFGVKTNSFAEPENVFYKMGQALMNFQQWRLVLSAVAPRIMRLLKIDLMPEYVKKFFSGMVDDTLERRERENIFRPDMLNLLMEAQKGALHHDQHAEEKDTDFAAVQEDFSQHLHNNIVLTNDDITSQVLVFFFAGFETTSVTMCFASYELTLNQNIQKRLQVEIDQTWNDCDGKLTYTAVQKMTYLDMVITETLRKWPPFVGTDRTCTKPFKFTFDDMELDVEMGMCLNIPIYGIHRDPQFYPKPELFDPERFSEENKKNIMPFTYLPFGIGPRSCIGSRFALMEAKIALIFMLRHFDLFVTKKTQIPLILKPGSTNLNARDGFWVGLKPRVHV